MKGVGCERSDADDRTAHTHSQKCKAHWPHNDTRIHQRLGGAPNTTDEGKKSKKNVQNMRSKQRCVGAMACETLHDSTVAVLGHVLPAPRRVV